jgi:hypothetical protein
MTVPASFLVRREALSALAARVLAELKGNRRAVLGLLAIAVLAGGYGLLLLGDAIDGLRGSYAEARLHLDRTVSAGTRTDWLARARTSTTARAAFENRLWPADSDGVARADLQDWITAAGHEAGVERLRVALELRRPGGLAPDIREVVATIAALQTEPALMRFLERIESAPHLLAVERLHVRQLPVASLDMTLISYARIVRAPGSTPR